VSILLLWRNRTTSNKQAYVQFNTPGRLLVPYVDVIAPQPHTCQRPWGQTFQTAALSGRARLQPSRYTFRNSLFSVSLDGQPVVSTIYTFSPDGEIPQTVATTQTDGTYSISRLLPGLTPVHYMLGATSGYGKRWLEAEVAIVENETTTVECDFPTGHDATVEGTVFFEGSPLPTAQIQVSQELADGARIHFSTTSDEQGHYRMENLSAGILEGVVSGHYPEGAGLHHKFIVETQIGHTTELDIDSSQ
jgi:hypothetical protein